jgi:tRNA-splicing ligase RtcB (3'-phosphate/5'-hydroxy nucleic acid ligase)
MPDNKPATERMGTQPGLSLELEQVDDFRWRLPRQGKMRVEGLVYADRSPMEQIRGDQSLQQVANVACLPGIVGRSIAMPDIHWGYGFPIGGVAAFDPAEGGVVSPGGVGYDIICGVRLLRSSLTEADIRPRLAALMNQIMRDVPAGVGAHYKRFALTEEEVGAVLVGGAAWAVEKGFGLSSDLERIEGGGALPGANPNEVTPRAIERGRDQLGTVGSGNHFIEVGVVDQIYDADAARALDLELGKVTILIHSGSRGLGYQVCDDFLQLMQNASAKYGIELPDRQLACAPLDSPEAQSYLGAMFAAANYAFGNRQMMAHRVREAFGRVLERPWEDLEMTLVYDVAHNIAKWEEHEIAGVKRRLCVHRKGATRAFPKGHPELAARFQALGQPVLIPGDMARYSYILVGTESGYREAFGSCCHGAGRRMSRHQAKKSTRGRNLREEFRALGLEVRAASFATIAEEVPEAYKDVAEVVEVVHAAGIARKVARLKPMGVLKG